MTVRVTGTVLDERGNGVPWVSISNGEFVVRTDARGRYEIDAEPGSHSFITVSVPDTHRVAGAFYRRVPMTDTTIDFELHSTPERQYEEFTLAQITDTHVRTEPYYRPQGAWLGPETGPRLTSDLRQLERESTPDLVLATGDLTDIGTTAELEHFRDSIAPIETPIRLVYGGHDGHVECGSARREPRQVRVRRGRKLHPELSGSPGAGLLQLRLGRTALRGLFQRGQLLHPSRYRPQGPLAD